MAIVVKLVILFNKLRSRSGGASKRYKEGLSSAQYPSAACSPTPTSPTLRNTQPFSAYLSFTQPCFSFGCSALRLLLRTVQGSPSRTSTSTSCTSSSTQASTLLATIAQVARDVRLCTDRSPHAERLAIQSSGLQNEMQRGIWLWYVLRCHVLDRC
ncbi:hypothetical protein BDW22DRAFT_496328 [Trametopsis cervina]|nr:hypothetical protein BDW22DRAFT_496328 [Trametopsis cervina]